jgi:hypothetical protein
MKAFSASFNTIVVLIVGRENLHVAVLAVQGLVALQVRVKVFRVVAELFFMAPVFC